MGSAFTPTVSPMPNNSSTHEVRRQQRAKRTRQESAFVLRRSASFELVLPLFDYRCKPYALT